MSSLSIPLGFKHELEPPQVRINRKPLRLSVRQQAERLLCSCKEPWDRLRFMDPMGVQRSESRDARAWEVDTTSLPSGRYWVVAEWAGRRSSHSVLL